MSRGREERRMLIISKELAEKIDLQRGDLSREEFLEFCIDYCLRSGGLERRGEISRGEMEEVRRSLKEVREEVIGRLEAINKAYERLLRIVSRLERRGEPRTAVSTLLESKPREQGSGAALILLRWDAEAGPSVRARYPEDWPWEERVTEEMLTAIYALTLMSKRQTEGMRLEFKNSKVASIAMRGDSLLLLVLDPGEEFKDYEDKIRGMAEEVEVIKDWEEALPQLFEDYLGRPLATT